MPIQIRPMKVEDVETCGRICYEAFKDISLMNKVFLDTSYAVALSAPGDENHKRGAELADGLSFVVVSEHGLIDACFYNWVHCSSAS